MQVQAPKVESAAMVTAAGFRAVSAVVMAGDRGAAKAVNGESKVYLEIGGAPARRARGRVAAARARGLARSGSSATRRGSRPLLGAQLRAALRSRSTSCRSSATSTRTRWQTYRRLLPGAPPEGRDPGPEDLDQRGALPLGRPARSRRRRRSPRSCAQSLARATATTRSAWSTEESMRGLLPGGTGRAGHRMAYFNVRDGRFRQSNLHLVRPARIGNRHYIEEMYEHRYQKEFGNIAGAGLAVLLLSEQGGLAVASLLRADAPRAAWRDRRGWRRLADWLRRADSDPRASSAASRGCSAALPADRHRSRRLPRSTSTAKRNTTPRRRASRTGAKEQRSARGAAVRAPALPAPGPRAR